MVENLFTHSEHFCLTLNTVVVILIFYVELGTYDLFINRSVACVLQRYL